MLSTGLHLAHYPPLSQERIPAEIFQGSRALDRLVVLAVGSKAFVDEIQALLGKKVRGRVSTVNGDKHVLCEMPMPYTVNIDAESNGLSSDK